MQEKEIYNQQTKENCKNKKKQMSKTTNTAGEQAQKREIYLYRNKNV
jgi:hypothetical protein